MLQVKQGAIQTLLLVEYSNILTGARRGVKGLRLQHLFSIQLLGQHPSGLGLAAAGRLTGRSPQCIQARFDRVIRAGFIRKENKRYYLTDTGARVYQQISESFANSMESIIKVLVEEARSRL